MTTVALVLWPFISLAFFRMLAVPAAIAATIIGGYLLLPVQSGYNPPLLPEINKNSVAALSAFVFVLCFAKKGTPSLPGWFPRSPVLLLMIGLLVVGAFGTALTNMDVSWSGPVSKPGMTPYDGGSMAMNVLVGLLPFLLARKFLATPESHRTLLIVLAVSGFAYSFPTLWEIRMSPQLNRQIYGFFPHEWRQHVRDGGFRPLVFLNHALFLAIFLSCSTIAAFGLGRIGEMKWRPAFVLGGFWLLMTLVLAKSFGAIVITFALLPLLLFLPFRMQILVAAAIAGMLVTYPVLRANHYVPVDRVVEVLSKINADRVGSLEFRLRSEDLQLARAKERPVFGWGGYDRSRVFNENGRGASVPDGQWIILFSQGGWFRYVGTLGLVTFAVFALAFRWRRYELHPATAVLSLVLAANLLDLIPNATLTSVTMLFAGALAGRLELARAGKPASSGVTSGAATREPDVAPPRPGAVWVPSARPGVAGAVSGTSGRGAQYSRFPSRQGRNG